MKTMPPLNRSLGNRRWVACFDLLGVRRLLQNPYGDLHALDAYNTAIDNLKGLPSEGIETAWFSDTFLLYAKNDSPELFSWIQSFAHSFCISLLIHRVPFRGALSCDHLHVDEPNRIYLGAGLVEAYEYAEAQDWIGFIFSPSAMDRLKELSLAEGRLHYIEHPVPTKSSKVLNGLLCCNLGNSGRVNGRHITLENLAAMRSQVAQDDSIKRKYDRTIEFLEKHKDRGWSTPIREP